MWHCPHCGALQAEAARCWVCRRSSTTCSTCRNFRTSLATDVGYCALDRRRRPLTGLELRGCWEGRPATADVTLRRPPVIHQVVGGGLRGFVPVEDVALVLTTALLGPADPGSITTATAAPFVEAREAPTSLFGDAER